MKIAIVGQQDFGKAVSYLHEAVRIEEETADSNAFETYIELGEILLETGDKGGVYFKSQWLNPLGGGMKTPVAADRRSVLAKYGSKFAALAHSAPQSAERGTRSAEQRTSSGLRSPSPQRGEGRGGQKTVRVRVIDWERPANNDFLLVSQFSVTGALYTCRPDLVGFVNGLPLVVIELKKPGVPARAAFDENLTHYKAEIPQLFWFNAMVIVSRGTDNRVGSLPYSKPKSKPS